MKKIALIIINLAVSLFGYSQMAENPKATCEDQAFNSKVNKLLKYTVDVVSVTELKNNLENVTLLDTRELNEYITSRIPGAIHFGYDNPKWDILDELDKDTEIIVYCSVGYRSEKIGEKLITKGFSNVRNLYGSIFEWANQGYELSGPRDRSTNKIHTYNKRWSKWVINEEIEKIF